MALKFIRWRFDGLVARNSRNALITFLAMMSLIFQLAPVFLYPSFFNSMDISTLVDFRCSASALSGYLICNILA